MPRIRPTQFSIVSILCSLFLTLSLPLLAQAPWNNILAPSRATRWDQTAGIPGYSSNGKLPSDTWSQCGSTITAYGSSGSPASPAQIINALTACKGTNSYVLLGPGNFYLSPTISMTGVSGVELRGSGANQTHVYFYSTDGLATCGGGNGPCLIGFQDNNQESAGSVGTAAKWTAGYTQGTKQITVNNAAILDITPNQTLLVLDEDDTGYSGNTTAAGGSGVTGSAVDNGNAFQCADAYTVDGSTITGCSYNAGNGGYTRLHRWQEEGVTVASCSPSCSNAGTTVLTLNQGLIHANWFSSQGPEVWPIQPATYVGVRDMQVDGSNITSFCFGILLNDTMYSWVKGVEVTNSPKGGINLIDVALSDISSNYVYNTGQSSVGNDPNNADPGNISLNYAWSNVVANNISQWARIGIWINLPASGNVIAYNYIINAFESNSTMWWALADGHSNGDDYNLYEGNVAPQFAQDQTHGGKLFSSIYRNAFWGWQSCSNGECGPLGTPEQTQANVDAVFAGAYNRYSNFVGNVLGTPSISSEYVFTNAEWFWSSTTGYGHIFNLASGNTGWQGTASNAPLPIDPVTLASDMIWDNWDAADSATMLCTGSGTPNSACPQDERADTAAVYPGLSSPSTTLAASFYYTARPAWWASSIAFPAIGPDVTGGNVGQCGGTPNTEGQYALVPATSASQCAGQGLNAAWAGHVNAIPAMSCFLNTMAGPPDGYDPTPMTFNANNCYGTGGGESQVDEPSMSPGGGTYSSAQTVTISDGTSSAKICYTTDGSTPTAPTAGTCSGGTTETYSTPINVSSTTTINALGTLSGWTNSIVNSQTYTISSSQAAAPTFSLPSGAYPSGTQVTLSTTSQGCSSYIFWGTSNPPGNNSTSFTVQSAATIYAYVHGCPGFADSNVVNESFTIATQAATPTFSPVAGTYTSAQTVTISDGTSGATIYYTTNGTTPTTSSTHYTAAITVSASETLEAIATATGLSQSAVGSAAYTINLTAATPTFSPAAGTYTSIQTVTISDGTSGATIYYTTNGTTPTTSSSVYSSAITVSASETLKAIAAKTGYTTSAVGSAAYTINLQAAAPTFSLPSGAYPSGTQVTLSTTSPGCSSYIYWGTSNPPTNNSTSFSVTANATIYAYVHGCPGYTDSSVVNESFTVATQAATPTFSPAAGTYSSTQTVTISDGTSGATIYYTTNGTTPTTSSTHYTAAITVSASETLEAIATASGYLQSAVGSAAYTISSGTWSAGGAAPNVSYSGSSCSVSMAVSAGDLVWGRTTDATQTTTTLSIADTLGVSFNSPANLTDNARLSYKAWYGIAPTSGTETLTFTTNDSASTQQCVGAYFKWSAASLSGNPVDQTGTNNSYSSSPSATTTGNLTANGELVVGDCMTTGAAFTGPGTGLAVAGSASSNDNIVEYLGLASGSGSGATQTITVQTATTGWTCTVATFKHP